MPDAITISHIIITIIELIAGGGIIAGYVQLRKLRGDIDLTENKADKLAAESWVLLITQLQKRVKNLEDALSEKDQRIDDLEDEVAELRQYMIDNGLNPPPRKRKKIAP